MSITKRAVALLLSLVIFISLFSCRKSNRFSESYLEYFDTVTVLTVSNVSQKEFDEIAYFVKNELKNYHMLFDIYNLYEATNNIKTINDNAGVAPVCVSDELIEFLEYSIDLYDTTNGYFNIALGSVLKLWHECRENATKEPESARIPDKERLIYASLHTNIDDIIIDRASGTVFLKDKEMSIDVGAIAKGYTAQKIYDKLRALGYADFVLSIGGNVIASGNKNGTSAWQIGIEDPSDTSKTICSLSLSERSLVTSGSYQRYYTVGEVRYHHIINPYSLMPENNYLAVSVIHTDSGLADAMSTALFNMSYEIGGELVKNTAELEAMWILNDGTIKYSENFLNYVNN